MKRYIRSEKDYTTDTLVQEPNITDSELVSEYGDDGVIYEFDDFDEAWRWLNAEED